MFFLPAFYRHPEFRRGFNDMLGITPGIAAWGLMTGVAMVKSGMSTVEALFMALRGVDRAQRPAVEPRQDLPVARGRRLQPGQPFRAGEFERCAQGMAMGTQRTAAGCLRSLGEECRLGGVGRVGRSGRRLAAPVPCQVMVSTRCSWKLRRSSHRGRRACAA